MKKIAPYFIFISIGLLVVWLCKDGCKGKSAAEQLQDSLNIEKKLNDSIKVAHVLLSQKLDSTTKKNTKDSLSYTHVIDSQKHLIATLQGRFKVTKDSIGTLYGQLKEFYLAHDTVALQETYTRLNDELSDANAQLWTIQQARDSADNIRDAEIARLRGVIVTLQSQLGDLNKLLTESTANQEQTAKTAQKAVNKLKRANLFGKIAGGIAIVLGAIVLIK